MHDVVIVGARAAGAATALLLARLGHDVVVVDRVEPSTDTISTHQIARTGMVSLQRWGLTDKVVATGAPPLREVTFGSPDGSVTMPIGDKSGVDYLLAPRRYILDALLADAASGAGATVHTGVSVVGVLRDDGGRVVGVHGHDGRGEPVELRASFVVGADGLSSTIARAVGAPLAVDRGAPGAAQYAYFAGQPWSMEFTTGPGLCAGVFPTHDGEAAIWVSSPAEQARALRRELGAEAAFATQLRRAAPEVADRLATARRTSPVRGILRAPNHIRHAHGPGWALVGDAAGHRDPITGYGLSDAFRDAELLAAAIDAALAGAGDEPLAAYDRTRRAELAEVFEITCQFALFPPARHMQQLTRRLTAAIDAAAATVAARSPLGRSR